MKVNVEVDCTPEEARALMGLPDLTPVHDAYIGSLVEAVRGGGISRETIEAMMKNWMPMGEAGMQLWQTMLSQVTGAAKR